MGTTETFPAAGAVQGLGNVGWNLCRLLAEAGAYLQVTDIDQDRVARAVKAFEAQPTQPEAIYAVYAISSLMVQPFPPASTAKRRRR